MLFDHDRSLHASLAYLFSDTKENSMKRRTFMHCTTACLALLATKAWSFPTVFPHGVTLYNPKKCWGGYTVFPTEAEGEGSVLIDMNGNVVKQWKAMSNTEHPVKILKGGYIMGATNSAPGKKGRTWADKDSADLSIMDFNGKIIRNIPLAGMHHDYQVASSPTGYYAPGLEVLPDDKNILILSHKFTENPKITDKKPLDDDYIVEVDKNNNVVWDWLASDYFDQMNFPEEFKQAMYKTPTWQMTRTPGVKAADWIHMNSMSKLGPNKWFEEDPVKYAAFNPENIITCNRQTNTSFIIDKKSKNIVWHIGPLYYKDSVWKFGDKEYPRALERLGQLIGPHHTHMIPKGLPGAGNIMVYDNGGYAGYGPRNPGAPAGWSDARRDYSRVIEFNPVTLDIVWEHSANVMGMRNRYQFYSDYVSSAQRLPNGNTLITNGAVGQLQEVTAENEVVWEYISPWYNPTGKYNLVYRAYRVPYDYVPQVKKTKEQAVTPPKNSEFRIQPTKG